MTTRWATKLRSARPAVVTTAVLALTVTACAGNDSAADTGKAKVTDADIPSFTVALNSQPPGYDAATSAQPYVTSSVMSLVTEPLERYNDNGTFTPALATKVAQPDPTTLVYTLRDGVKFSDGQPLTAEDVAWSITHTATPPAQTSASVRSFKSASATGPLQVTVKLSSATPLGRVTLAQATLIQEKKFAVAHQSDLGTANAIPVGTGPYTVGSATASGITLNRRTGYWGTEPKIQKVDFKVVSDDNSAQLAMRSGEVDLRQIGDVKTAAQWRAIPGTSVLSSPSGSVNFLAMDVSKAPFDDIHVRRAISHATDVAGLIKAAWGGEATALKGLMPVDSLKVVAGGEAAVDTFLDSLPDHALDLDEAKKELAQSSHPKGFSTTVEYVSEVPATKVVALSLQQNLKPLGIDIKTKAVTLNAWSAKFYQHKLTGLIVGFGFTAEPDPSAPLASMVGKANMGPQKANLANFTTPEVEKALPTLSTAGADAARWDAAKTVIAQVADQAAYVPLASEDLLMAVGKGFASDTGKITARNIQDGSWVLDIRATQQ
ncbi:ABC transporter substrate-binding protein [Streptomyces sp. NPDC003247]|uniref:ABC transporter substrate-binding protein n=1 Tax=Streptomyces sp. NPDC003247 TaxID=3364677 RepID=UPI0036A9C64C